MYTPNSIFQFKTKSRRKTCCGSINWSIEHIRKTTKIYGDQCIHQIPSFSLKPNLEGNHVADLSVGLSNMPFEVFENVYLYLSVAMRN